MLTWIRLCALSVHLVVASALLVGASLTLGCSSKKIDESAQMTERAVAESKPKLLEGQVLLTQGEMLAASCYGCHGTDGDALEGMPTLKGSASSEIEMALKEFREGKKESTMMVRHMKGYSDEQIKSIAETLSAKK